MASIKEWIHAPLAPWSPPFTDRFNEWMHSLRRLVAAAEDSIASLQATVTAWSSAWTDYNPTVSGFTTNAANTDAAYLTRGKDFKLRFFATATGAGTASAIIVPLPVTMHTGMRNRVGWGTAVFFDASSGLYYEGQVKVQTNGTDLTFWDADSATAGGAVAAWVGNGVPAIVAAGDTLTVWFMGEIA